MIIQVAVWIHYGTPKYSSWQIGGHFLALLPMHSDDFFAKNPPLKQQK